MSGKIRYCMIPTRLREELGPKASEIVRGWGDAPVIPFNVGPFDDFEGNPQIGRQRTLRLMVDLKNACDADALFGVSEGTMIELKDTLANRDKFGIERDVRVHYGLDPEWEAKYVELKPKFGDLFARLRGPHALIALVGARAAGKTFLSDHLLRVFGNKLRRVKNTTTRLPRNEQDYESYNFVSKEDFSQGIRENRFLEYDQYQDNFYGSSLAEIKSVLKTSCGIFAITPPGAKALFAHRYEINLKFLLLAPESEAVLRKNLETRGIKDPTKQKELIEEANSFVLPEGIEHQKVTIVGETQPNLEKIVEIAELLICE